MQIKRFEAKNMTTALRMIKGELGPEAVILSARSLRKGKGFFGSMKYAGVEVTAAIDTLKNRSIEENSGGGGTDPTKLSTGQPRHRNHFAGPDASRAADHPASGRNLRSQPVVKSKADASYHRELSALYQQTLTQGVDRVIASGIIDEIKRVPAARDLLMSGDLNAHLCTILEEMGAYAQPTALGKGRPSVVALLGATGVGKTTTIAKLAAIQSRGHQKQVAVISIDNHSIAANAQLKVYSRIMGIPLETAVSRLELKRAIKRFQSKDLILIDSPGVNPADKNQLLELKTYFDDLPDLEKHLVLSVTTKEKDLIETAQAFKPLGIRRLLFTKLDESSTYGNIINGLIRTGIPLSYLSHGRKVPDDIAAGSIQRLVDLIFQFKDLARRPSDEASPTTPAEAERRPEFVANKNSDVYHYRDCKWSDRIKAENIIQFDSSQQAEAQNFLPCRGCNPDLPKGADIGEAGAATRKFSIYQ